MRRIERKERAHLHTVRSHSKSPDRKSVSSLSVLLDRFLLWHLTAVVCFHCVHNVAYLVYNRLHAGQVVIKLIIRKSRLSENALALIYVELDIHCDVEKRDP